ncbi:MAG TPA: isochorismatase family protein [Phycisphaerales bacterium]|nr:isochorismatase family protein [Phycisphaerales bacterium]
MPIPRLKINSAALLVVDVQERLLPTIIDRERVVANCTVLVHMAEELRIPYVITEQYPKGLGRTDERITRAMADQSRRIEKTRFSALDEMVDSMLRGWERNNVILCGLEAHVCVMQTALDLQASGRQCYLCSDAVSAGQRDQIPHALERMRTAGVVITGVLSAMYELLGDSTHGSFRKCLKLAKAIEQ